MNSISEIGFTYEAANFFVAFATFVVALITIFIIQRIFRLERNDRIAECESEIMKMPEAQSFISHLENESGFHWLQMPDAKFANQKLENGLDLILGQLDMVLRSLNQDRCSLLQPKPIWKKLKRLAPFSYWIFCRFSDPNQREQFQHYEARLKNRYEKSDGAYPFQLVFEAIREWPSGTRQGHRN